MKLLTASIISAALLLAGQPAGAQSAKQLPTDSLDLKIGQMIMIGIDDRTAVQPGDPLLADLAAGRAGGVVLFEKNLAPAATREKLVRLISALRQAAPAPLFVSIDEEGGRVHRLKEKYGFVGMPSAAVLGRRNNPDTTLFYNRRLAAELQELGINLNYAPTVDVAVNPANPVIVQAGRSFSADPGIVADNALLVLQAHHEHGVRTILKHFPGHGSSANDSHFGIVDVTQSWQPEELVPYRRLISTGQCEAVMTAHIINRRWDSSGLPATLSRKVVTGMLRGELGFTGVVFSDDMQMGAIAKNYGFENAVGLAVNAGVDVLLFGNTVGDIKDRVTAGEVHRMIRKLVLSGRIPRDRIDAAYRRIRALKQTMQ